MIKQISLNIDDNTTLPLTITINGNTYYSQFSLATAQTSYFEMGKAVGIEMGMEGELTWSDAQHGPDYMKGYETGKHEGYIEGHNAGYEHGRYDKGISEINYNTEPIAQTAESEAYDNGFIKGKEEGWNE